MKPIIGIVTKPLVAAQFKGSLWDELLIKQNFADILFKHDVTSLGIIPSGITINRIDSNDITPLGEDELTKQEQKHIVDQLELCSGIILQGGLSSHRYELFIARYAIEHNIPLLGICAGFNNIALAVGVRSKYIKGLSEIHDIYDSKKCHPIKIEDTAIHLAEYKSEDWIHEVNSLHRMMILEKSIHENDRINIEATTTTYIPESGDEIKTVEAFSLKGVDFALGIKWHPELLPNDSLTEYIFSKFTEQARLFAEKHGE